MPSHWRNIRTGLVALALAAAAGAFLFLPAASSAGSPDRLGIACVDLSDHLTIAAVRNACDQCVVELGVHKHGFVRPVDTNLHETGPQFCGSAEGPRSESLLECFGVPGSGVVLINSCL